MTDDEICGETKTDGEKCTFDAKYKDGKCGHHTDHGEEQGRPSKLTKGIVDKITRHIAEGKSDAEAFRKVSLHPSTKGNWLQKVDPEDVDRTPEFEDDPYGYFFRRYTHAKGLGEEWYTDNIMDLAVEQGDLRVLLSMMKQRYPDSWSETETGVDADTTIINVPDSVAEKWERV